VNNTVISPTPTGNVPAPAAGGNPITVNSSSTPTGIVPSPDPGITGGGTLVTPTPAATAPAGIDFRLLLPLTGSALSTEAAAADGAVAPDAPAGADSVVPRPASNTSRLDGAAATLQPQSDESAVAPPVAESSLSGALEDFLALVGQARGLQGRWLFGLGIVPWLLAGAVGATVLEGARRKYRRVAADALFTALAAEPNPRRSFPRLRFTCLSGGA